ncbi:Mitochondrial GTPase 1 [Mitosporidium daphniae]
MHCPRPRFDFNKVPKITWFPGHMHAAIKKMRENMSSKVDIVIEVRDSRVPISCINPLFEELFETKRRIIVYNKRDLAGASPFLDAVKTSQKSVIGIASISAKEDNPHKQARSADAVLDIIRARYPPTQVLPSTFRLRGLVVGMPNVGKSTLINSLRNVDVKATKVGKLPGFTRSISGEIKVLEHPSFYIMDSPGLMLPRIIHPEMALKMSLTAMVKESILGEILIADYLLFRLNLLPPDGEDRPFYVKYFRMDAPTEDVGIFLEAVATRLGLVKKGGTLDIHLAAVRLIRMYNEGFFGSFSLD